MRQQSLPGRERLKTDRQFKEVFNHGRKIKGRLLDLYYTPNMLQYNRLGIIVSTKCFKLASKRGRIKRLVRESYRKNKKQFFKNLDIVLVNKTREAGLAYSDFEKELNMLYKQVGKQA